MIASYAIPKLVIRSWERPVSDGRRILGLFDRLLLILDRLRAPVGKPFRRDFSKTRESNRWQKVSATSELKIKNEFLGYLSQKVNEFEQIWSSFVRYTGSI